jgi:hypothetical protein
MKEEMHHPEQARCLFIETHFLRKCGNLGAQSLYNEPNNVQLIDNLFY